MSTPADIPPRQVSTAERKLRNEYKRNRGHVDSSLKSNRDKQTSRNISKYLADTKKAWDSLHAMVDPIIDSFFDNSTALPGQAEKYEKDWQEEISEHESWLLTTENDLQPGNTAPAEAIQGDQAAQNKARESRIKEYDTTRKILLNEIQAYEEALPEDNDLNISFYEDLKVKYVEMKDQVEVELLRLAKGVDVIPNAFGQEQVTVYMDHKVELLQQLKCLKAKALARLRPRAVQ